MQPLFYVIAIMGCSDGGQACQQQRIEPVQYTNSAACEAAVPTALERNADLDYPMIEAACRANGQLIVDNNRVAGQRS